MTKMDEATTDELARMLHRAVFAIPDKPVSRMSKVEYSELRRGELARELLFWLAGRTHNIETFIAFPMERMADPMAPDYTALAAKEPTSQIKDCRDSAEVVGC